MVRANFCSNGQTREVADIEHVNVAVGCIFAKTKRKDGSKGKGWRRQEVGRGRQQVSDS